MIDKLKKRFIALAMVSLAVLLALIVAGMNIINYRTVVSDADRKIEILEENSGRLFSGGRDFGRQLFADDLDEIFFGRKGPGGPSMSLDEAEESRFFTVTLDSSGNVYRSYVDRIYAVDSSEAEDMAKEVLASGKEAGFMGDFRYSVDEEGSYTKVMFLDCGRTLESFRDFLKASVLMSLLGLLAVFFVMLYFAGRIVRPVAESYEKQKRFITDAGHEIKTPLAIIKANLDLMDMDLDRKSVDREELRDSLGDINDQVDRLTGLTNDLVYLSRMEEGESALVMTEVPLSDIVTETVSSFEPLARERGREIRADIAPMISVNGSHKELEKLLSILLENAVKYSSPDDAIGVSLKKEGRNAVLEVSNRTEEEFDSDSLSHVFERFYRADSSRNSATGGHGIGLSMASAIVNAHGGKITARTNSGHDFIVTATLPPT